MLQNQSGCLLHGEMERDHQRKNSLPLRYLLESGREDSEYGFEFRGRFGPLLQLYGDHRRLFSHSLSKSKRPSCQSIRLFVRFNDPFQHTSSRSLKKENDGQNRIGTHNQNFFDISLPPCVLVVVPLNYIVYPVLKASRSRTFDSIRVIIRQFLGKGGSRNR